MPWIWRMCADNAAKMTIYSAHDTTVFSLLAALGATADSPLPGFTSHVSLELWESHKCDDTHEFSVRLLYNHLPYDAPDAPGHQTLLTVSPACDQGECSLDDLISGTSDSVMAPEDCERGGPGVSQHFQHEPEDTQCCKAQAP